MSTATAFPAPMEMNREIALAATDGSDCQAKMAAMALA